MINYLKSNPLFLAIPLGIISYILLLSCMPNGIHFGGDSIEYLTMAQKASSLEVPKSELYSPGYPLFLGVFDTLSFKDIYFSAKFYAATIFSLCTILMYILFFEVSNKNIAISVIGTIAFFASSFVLTLSSKAVSESTFLFFFLLFLLSLWKYFLKGNLISVILIGVSLIGLIATKYTGLLFLVVLAPFMLIYNSLKNHSTRYRIIEIVITIIIPILYYFIWINYNKNSSKLAPSEWEGFDFSTMLSTGLGNLHDISYTFSAWFLPQRIAMISFVHITIFFSCILLGVYYVWKIFVKNKNSPFDYIRDYPFPSYLIISSICYSGALFALQLLINLREFDNRTLLWVYISILLLLGYISNIAGYYKGKVNKILPLLFLILTINLNRSYANWQNWNYGDNELITEIDNSNSLIEYYNEHVDKNTIIYSNYPEILLFKLNHNNSYAVPRLFSLKGKLKENFTKEEIISLYNNFNDTIKKEGLILFFNSEISVEDRYFIDLFKNSDNYSIIESSDGWVMKKYK